MKHQDITILGAGSWGTALAIQLAENGRIVHLWGRDPAHLQSMQATHYNQRYLPENRLADQIKIQADLEKAVTAAQDILMAVPSHSFRETLLKIKPYLTSRSRIISAAKGLDPVHHQLLHDLANLLLGGGQVFSCA